MQRILVPTDFSGPAINATEYAARLAGQLGAGLTLLHVQKIYLNEGLRMASGSEPEFVQEARSAEEQLNETAAEITRSFGVDCEVEVISSVKSFESRVADKSRHFDLTIIGSNGADTAFQFYFGSHSFRVARKSRMPALIIPEGCRYEKPGRIAFFSDFRKGEKLLVSQLLSFAMESGAKVLPVHICARNDDTQPGHADAFEAQIRELNSQAFLLPVEKLTADDAVDSAFRHVTAGDAGMLAMSMVPHGFFFESTHVNLVKKITSGTSYPFLAFHA